MGGREVTRDRERTSFSQDRRVCEKPLDLRATPANLFDNINWRGTLADLCICTLHGSSSFTFLQVLHTRSPCVVTSRGICSFPLCPCCCSTEIEHTFVPSSYNCSHGITTLPVFPLKLPCIQLKSLCPFPSSSVTVVKSVFGIRHYRP